MDQSKHTIGIGSHVILHFSLTLKDGTVAEDSFKDEPVEFVIGDGAMIEGLESVLYGLQVGDRKKLTLNPRDAFGDPVDENIHNMPRSEFSDDIELAPGLIIGFTTPSGDEVPGTIVEVSNDDVKVDFNHPLSGHELIFEFEIIDVKPADTALH